MTNFSNLRRRRFDAPCRVEIEHSADSLHAHVELYGEFDVQPGDEVLVHDAPSFVPFGTRLVVQRIATVTRAGLLDRLWARVAGHFEVTELYEVSFSDRRSL